MNITLEKIRKLGTQKTLGLGFCVSGIFVLTWVLMMEASSSVSSTESNEELNLKQTEIVGKQDENRRLADRSESKKQNGNLQTFQFQAEKHKLCSEGGCHELSDLVEVIPEQTEQLLTAIAASDSMLADRIRLELKNGSARSRDILDRYCLVEVSINPESRVKVDLGQAISTLRAGLWNTYLVKIKNLAGITSPLMVSSEQSFNRETKEDQLDPLKWMELELFQTRNFSNFLSGAPLEYRILRLRTDQIGKRSAIVALNVGEGTADIGFRNDVMLTFDSLSPPDSTVDHKVSLTPSSGKVTQE